MRQLLNVQARLVLDVGVDEPVEAQCVFESSPEAQEVQFIRRCRKVIMVRPGFGLWHKNSFLHRLRRHFVRQDQVCPHVQSRFNQRMAVTGSRNDDNFIVCSHVSNKRSKPFAEIKDY